MDRQTTSIIIAAAAALLVILLLIIKNKKDRKKLFDNADSIDPVDEQHTVDQNQRDQS